MNYNISGKMEYLLIKNGNVVFRGNRKSCYKKLLEIRPVIRNWHREADKYAVQSVQEAGDNGNPG